MGTFSTILAILGISFTFTTAEWGPPLVPLDPSLTPSSEESPISGPRLRRQYYGGPYEYQAQDYPNSYQDYTNQYQEYSYQSPDNSYSYKPGYGYNNYRTPILSRAHTSARNLASYFASDYDDDYDYCPPNNPRENKKNTMKIFQEVVGNKITRNMDKYFLASYIQHNPTIADGIEPFRKALSPGGLLFGPREPIDFQRVGADGDIVYIHARRVRANGDVFAHADIFRWECGKIAEHWDVIQNTELTTPAANKHPFF